MHSCLYIYTHSCLHLHTNMTTFTLVFYDYPSQHGHVWLLKTDWPHPTPPTPLVFTLPHSCLIKLKGEYYDQFVQSESDAKSEASTVSYDADTPRLALPEAAF